MRASDRIVAHVLEERSLLCQLECNRVGRVVGICGDLNGQLASGAQAGRQLPQQSRVIGHPLQAGVGENDVEAGSGVEAADVAQFEPQTVAGQG